MRGLTVRLAAILWATVLVIFLSAAPAAAKPPTAEFAPGTWHGKAVWTGGISNGDITANVAGAGIISFELVVEPAGTISNGLWALSPTTINETVSGIGNATGKVDGMGNLSGVGALVKIDGTLNVTVNIPSLGIGDVSVGGVPADGQFYPTTASCTFVQGDMATEGRAAQQAAGFATSVKAPFTATRTAGPGQNGNESWDEAYVKLVEQMTTLMGTPKPKVKDVLDLVDKIGQFQANLVAASTCSDAPKNLQKGKQPYTWFVQKFTEMMQKILSDPSGYTGSDISEMLMAAVQIGAVGSAAPDDTASIDLEIKFLQVLGQKLDADIANNDKLDALMIYIAAKQAGFGELAAKAHDFAL